MPQTENLRRAALVTGGAKGIGRAICRALAENGMNIAVNYAGSAAAAEETAAACRALGVQAVTLQADVRSPEACQKLVEDTAAAFGRIDVLVNNAGITADKLLLRMTEADFDNVLATNLKGAFFCTKAACRFMMHQRYGRIISVSSVVGLHGNAGQVNYAASKAGLIAIRFGLQGICSCPTTACAGGTNAIGDAFHRIRDGYEDRMLCGGSESCISPLGVGGFASMKALCTADDPARASIPFDARRSGFVMGEGSGVLLLEELEAAKARGAKIYAEVVGYGANCDAYHFTAPAPGGAGGAACMRLALADGGVVPEQIGYINAHGTSTHLNDSCETTAIKTVFGGHAYKLAVSSTKSMTGHLLGGAGGVEGVFTALALHDAFLPATVNLQEPDPELDLDYIPNHGRAAQVEYAMSDSLGFGGHNACVVFKRWEG